MHVKGLTHLMAMTVSEMQVEHGPRHGLDDQKASLELRK
jgi:hypothetical protein